MSGPIENILAERQQRYGGFWNQAFFAEALQRIMQGAPNWTRMSHDQRQSLLMQAHKQARILTGDPNYIDSWRDVEGYARLVADRLEDAVRQRAEGGPPQDHGPELVPDGPPAD